MRPSLRPPPPRDSSSFVVLGTLLPNRKVLRPASPLPNNWRDYAPPSPNGTYREPDMCRIANMRQVSGPDRLQASRQMNGSQGASTTRKAIRVWRGVFRGAVPRCRGRIPSDSGTMHPPKP